MIAPAVVRLLSVRRELADQLTVITGRKVFPRHVTHCRENTGGPCSLEGGWYLTESEADRAYAKHRSG